MIHLYCGDGKGKTTCAFGLALRALGRGMHVAVAQFLKGSDSGEREALAQFPGARLLPVPEELKFVFQMDETERQTAAAQCLALLEEAERAAEGGGEMVVLDECCAAISTGLLPLERVTEFLDRWGCKAELVLTGRDPAPELLERADYVTEMKKQKHPFDRGIPARKGVEW